MTNSDTEPCDCGPLPGVVAPMDTPIGIQMCDTCRVFSSDLDAALALARLVGGIVRFPVSRHGVNDDGPTGEVFTYDGTPIPHDVGIATPENPWVEIDGEPVDWMLRPLHRADSHGVKSDRKDPL